jgi:hypothetical protein
MQVSVRNRLSLSITLTVIEFKDDLRADSGHMQAFRTADLQHWQRGRRSVRQAESFPARSVVAGFYTCRLRCGDQTTSMKMTLVR